MANILRNGIIVGLLCLMIYLMEYVGGYRVDRSVTKYWIEGVSEVSFK